MKSPHHGPTTPESRPQPSKTKPKSRTEKRAIFAERLNQAFDLHEVHPLDRPGVIARTCGVSLLTAMNYLSGKTEPRRDGTYYHLSERLEVPALWLATGSAPDGRAIDVNAAHDWYRYSSLPPMDRVRVRRLLVAIDNGSRLARRLNDAASSYVEAAALYEKAVKQRARVEL